MKQESFVRSCIRWKRNRNGRGKDIPSKGLSQFSRSEQWKTKSSNYKYVQPAIPKFDGHYDHWTKLMENFPHSKEYWHLVEHGILVVVDKATTSDAELKLMEEQQLKDLKIKNYLYQAIDQEILDIILNDDTSKTFGIL
ncbi:hypothetical protein CR513_17116, partial [Mucuna pruriens]